MLFSIHTDQHIIDANGIFGYSYGYHKTIENFNKFKYRNEKMNVVKNDKASPIQMFYMEPEWYNLKTMTSFRSPEFQKFHDHQYKIYGTYLETTRVWSHWIEAMKQVDEIWVGNKFSVDAIKNSGIETPVYIFELGLDKIWQPYKRKDTGVVRFLHVDSGSPRKRADLVEKAFTTIFGDRNDVQLTLKYHSHEGDSGYSVMNLFSGKSNVVKLYKTLSTEEMVKLYQDHDVLLYPSEGEGFGLIPLQAMATGMPVISTGVWCDYERFFNSNIIDSTMGKTQHTGYFEGEVVLPDFDSLVSLIKKVYDDIDAQKKFFYDQAPLVIEEYDWKNKTDKVLNALIKRVGIEKFNPIKEYVVVKDFIYFKDNNRYIAPDGSMFDSENRIREVDKKVADSLVYNKSFRKATDDEIRAFNEKN